MKKLSLFTVLLVLAFSVGHSFAQDLFSYNPLTDGNTSVSHPEPTGKALYWKPVRMPVINDVPKWLIYEWESDGYCLIKGNISYETGDKIYHLPGWPDYESTVVKTEYGERWFCSEWDAYNAGWRAPYYVDRPKVYPNPYE